MKKLLLILLCLPVIGFGQVTSPSVVSSSGDSYSNSNVNMDFSIGEVVIKTHQNNTEILTQGFHQGRLSVQTDIVELEVVSKVYPNPTTSMLIVELEQNVHADLLVYDINGKLVLKDTLKDEQKKQLDFSFLKQGNYLLHINIAEKQSVYQINKSK